MGCRSRRLFGVAATGLAAGSGLVACGSSSRSRGAGGFPPSDADAGGAAGDAATTSALDGAAGGNVRDAAPAESSGASVDAAIEEGGFCAPAGPGGALPVVVSAQFVPSGFMGDGAIPGAVGMVPSAATDPQDCGGDRAAGAVGVCYSFTYTAVQGGSGWGGVYWQFPP